MNLRRLESQFRQIQREFEKIEIERAIRAAIQEGRLPLARQLLDREKDRHSHRTQRRRLDEMETHLRRLELAGVTS